MWKLISDSKIYKKYERTIYLVPKTFTQEQYACRVVMNYFYYK